MTRMLVALCALTSLWSTVAALGDDLDLRGSTERPSAESRTARVVAFSWPRCSALLQKFGDGVDPITRRVTFHSGLDLMGDYGAEVRASGKGTVIAAERRGNYGNMIEIDHGGGWSTRYAHLRALFVRVGEPVSGDKLIAEVASSGRSTGPHLHFEILKDGEPQDPLTHLPDDPECTRENESLSRGAWRRWPKRAGGR